MTRPRVSTNLAISADGKISSFPPRPSGWTSREDHARLLTLREDADALIVGRGTLAADRMTMTIPDEVRQPLRCIVSHKGHLDPALPVFHTPGGDIHLLVTGPKPSEEPPQVIVHRQSLAEFLTMLATDLGVRRLHCEGGGTLIRALAGIDAIDDFHLTLAGHTLFGGLRAPTATGIPGGFLPKSADFEISHFDPRPDLGECFLSYTRRK